MREIKVMLIMLIAVGLFAGSAFALVNQSFEVATEEYGYRFPAKWVGMYPPLWDAPLSDPTSRIVYHENDPGGAKFGDDYMEYAPSVSWIVLFQPGCENREVLSDSYTFELWLKRAPGSTGEAGIKLEWYNPPPGEYCDYGTNLVKATEYPHTFSADNTWEKQTVIIDPCDPDLDYRVPASATHVSVLIFRNASGDPTTSTYYFDGYTSSMDVPEPWNPIPAHDSSVNAATTTTINWSNPFTTDPCEIITATTVYFAMEPNDIYYESDANALSGVSPGDESATIPFSLADDEDYYWGVKLDVATRGTFSNYDTNARTGAWHFDTFDAPPVLFMKWMYVWLDMDDGFDTDANDVTVRLDGHVVDDGKSPVIYGWENVFVTSSEPNVIWLDPNDVEKPRVVLSATGDWEFGLTVTDARQRLEGEETYGSMHVIVHDTACDAAKGDPADQLLAGDVNEDCETDILDVVLVAESWLQCMSDKLIGIRPECTP